MLSLLLADLILITHALFVFFVIFGGVLVIKWRKIIWLHIPCAIWGALIEFMGWICPLTYLENYFYKTAGAASYTDGFVTHYLMPIIYPSSLTNEIQILLGISVLLINLSIYSYVWWQWRN